jgi:DNA-binding response OmpR family regulator
MLTKDYRLRATLDQIICDDWVTSEGSEPLFDRDDTLMHEFIDFETYLLAEDPLTQNPYIRTLIAMESLVIRTMFHNQMNAVLREQFVMSLTTDHQESLLKIMESSIASHPTDNFDFIFIDTLFPTKEISLQTIARIRSLGYQGRIVGMNHNLIDVEHEFIEAGATTVVPRPVATRELVSILSALRNEKEGVQGSGLKYEDHVNFVTEEECENAITLSFMARNTSDGTAVTDLSSASYAQRMLSSDSPTVGMLQANRGISTQTTDSKWKVNHQMIESVLFTYLFECYVFREKILMMMMIIYKILILVLVLCQLNHLHQALRST